MKKKNIEKVFQEKLQDFSQLPEEQVWERISSSLDKRKVKRRILPIWWQIAGVAALLVAGLFIFLPGGDLPGSEEIITNAVEDTTDIVKPGMDIPEMIQDEAVPIAVTEEKMVNDQEDRDSYSQKKPASPEFGSEDGSNKNGLLAGKQTAEDSGKKANPENAVLEDQNTSRSADVISTPATLAQLTPAIKETAKQGGDTNRKTEDSVVNTGNLALHSDKKTDEGKAGPEEVEEGEKPSLLDALAEQEEDLTADGSGSRWEVGPRVAPVLFSSLAQGSPIHSSFRDNAKSGNVNMSYGVAVSYEIAKRVKLRSGLHRVDFGYDTRDVSFSSSLNANTNGIIDNINYNLSSKNLVVRSNTNSGKIASENAQDAIGPDPSLNGKMVQEFGYLEVPLEVTYEVLDRKIGVNLVGGVSSLFLMNNTVVLEANGNTTEMGEANNINELNFSTNFGIGVSYEINDKLQLNLEPMFKYQLNTFSETSGNFQPFSMGVYSGLSFRF